MPLEEIQVPIQEPIQVSLQDTEVPLQNNHSVQSTPEKNIPPAVANPSLNPFIDDLTAIHIQENPVLPNVPSTVASQTVSPSKTITSQPPLSLPPLPTLAPMSSLSPLPILPPIPPRQRSFNAKIGIKSTDPIRIPIHLVRPNKPENTKNATDIINNNNTRPITPNVMQSKPVPEIYETSKQNGNGYFNGDHNTIENEMNNHEPSCPCKSGAHPKDVKCQENGYSQRATPAPSLSKLIDFQF